MLTSISRWNTDGIKGLISLTILVVHEDLCSNLKKTLYANKYVCNCNKSDFIYTDVICNTHLVLNIPLRIA